MISHPAGLAPLDFALPVLRDALDRLPGAVDVRAILDPSLGAEAFDLRRDAAGLCLAGGDAAGLMYGTLDLAEQFRRAVPLDDLSTGLRRPHYAFRALKFNLPWSAYRPGEVMTQHIDTCLDLDFWAQLIDMLAVRRFNVLSLWNLHPFPYMFRMPGYPEACMLDDEALARHQAMFRFVFRRCRERGIRPFVLFWNIFVSDRFARTHQLTYLQEGPEYLYGPGDTSDLVARYNRACVTQLINDYPDLAGIGIATGDRMQNLTPAQREQWIENVILPGMRDADRPVDFIHRAPFTQDPQLVRDAITRANLPGKVYVEYKFNWSHAHSTPRLAMTHDETRPAAPGAVPAVNIDDRYWNPPPTDYKLLWMARNEDFFLLRWGEPHFIREHIRENRRDFVDGYFVGSEGYVPAKEFAQLDPPHRWAFERQWLFYLLWGRLLFDPATPDAVFEQAMDERYGEGVGRPLLRAVAAGSRMPLRLAAFHGATWDYTLYSEGFLACFPSLGRHDGCPFINILEFIEHPTLDRQRLMSIPEFVEHQRRGTTATDGRLSPLALATECDDDAGAAEAIAAELRRQRSPALRSPLDLELADVEAWVHLSRYLACKLRAGVALQRHRQDGGAAAQAEAVRELEAGLEHWRQLALLTSRTYRQVPYLERRTGRIDFHWADLLADVRRDIDLARSATPLATEG